MSQSSKNIETASSRISSQGFSTTKLKELIQEEVFDILSGIKQEIQKKMKEVDRNIHLLRTQIIELRKSTMRKSQTPNDQTIEESIKLLLLKVQKIQKEISILKVSSNLNDTSSYFQNSQASKSHITTHTAYKPNNQQTQKSNSKQKNTNSPLFRKSQNQTIDISSLIFQEQNHKSSAKLNKSDVTYSEANNRNRSQKKTSIFNNNSTISSNVNMKKPPLPSSSSQSKLKNVPSQYSTSSTSFYNDQTQNNINNIESRKNSIMQQPQYFIQQNISSQPLQKQLSKNKNVFMRRKKSEQKPIIQSSSPVQRSQPTTSTHRFENQLQEFGEKEDESFNIELQYSKDTFLSDL